MNSFLGPLHLSNGQHTILHESFPCREEMSFLRTAMMGVCPCHPRYDSIERCSSMTALPPPFIFCQHQPQCRPNPSPG
ncbi:hypothetical protein, partial, partial [Absidia glauca]